MRDKFPLRNEGKFRSGIVVVDEEEFAVHTASRTNLLRSQIGLCLFPLEKEVNLFRWLLQPESNRNQRRLLRIDHLIRFKRGKKMGDDGSRLCFRAQRTFIENHSHSAIGSRKQCYLYDPTCIRASIYPN